MDAEKVVCYDRGGCGSNDALLASLVNGGGMSGAWNNPLRISYLDVHDARLEWRWQRRRELQQPRLSRPFKTSTTPTTGA